MELDQIHLTNESCQKIFTIIDANFATDTLTSFKQIPDDEVLNFIATIIGAAYRIGYSEGHDSK